MRGSRCRTKWTKPITTGVRAREMRKIAEGLFDHEERKTLMDVALEYEELSLRRDVSGENLELANRPRKRPNGADHKSRGDSS
jgi:DNA-directed RNA polymerase subunit K/omega